MFPYLAFGYGDWWIFPIITIAMMVLCFFMMRGHAGSMMCGPGVTGPKEITDRWSRGTITMRTARNTCMTMLEARFRPQSG